MAFASFVADAAIAVVQAAADEIGGPSGSRTAAERGDARLQRPPARGGHGRGDRRAG